MKNIKLNDIKSTGFNLPDGYLESFDDKLLNKLEGKTQLESINSGFKTPEGYFKTVEETIINKVSINQKTKVISLVNKKTVIYISSIAAAVLLLFNLSIFEKQPSFNNLDTESVENYLIDENMSSYEIASLLTDEQLNDEDFIEHSLEEENIEEYLIEHADIETLMLE
ncbi:hypothetical protein VOI54_15060 [Tamlana sp. 2201CG12-4]|uniref:hypothetical protein n=1 Tax=Tamlana sp. 2201CG12-4 TaxID=3112582 RepID=UPI002DB8C0DD|nr:hypothetical protein [Tamlana sp. 2201CG12-4]MEC3908348.1 hypothetical protein [Tamlana sp. 2201CG12-4]